MVADRWEGRKVARLRALVLAEYGNVCHLCGGVGADSVDHVIPRSCGGDDSLDNLRPAHRSCNYSRGNASMIEWRRRRGVGKRASPSRNWKK